MLNRIYQVINGEKVDVTTVMDKTVSYIPTDEEVSKVKSEVKKHIDEFFPGLLIHGYGIDQMFKKHGGDFWVNKGWIIEKMKSHPLYNGNLQIVIPNSPMRRGINQGDCREFFNFCFDHLNNEKFYLDPKNGNHLTRAEVAVRCREIDKQDDTACRLYNYFLSTGNGAARSRVCDLIERLRNMRRAITESHYVYGRERFVLALIRDYICAVGADAQFVDEDLEKQINETMEDNRFTKKGQKISKLIGKIARRTGLSNVVDIRDTSFTTITGERITRQKDFGWNYMFAKFGDAINPIDAKATAVLSVHPVDYLRMSFGDNWSSCHTTDKQNRRRIDGSHNYSGMYCGGTESYMLDSSTILLYYLPEDWAGTNPEWEDKWKRCNFHLGQDKICQGRVYPDGRDGGDPTLASDMRSVVQKLVSEMFDEPNYWSVKRGTEAAEEMINSYGAHYRDYLCYSDCTMSFWKRIDGYQNTRGFDVGTDSICPECGEYHDKEDNIFCEDCVDRENKEYCERCGEYHYEDDGEWVESEDAWICNHCLREYYTYCDDVNGYVRDEDVVETEEGHNYHVDSYDAYGTCARCGEHHDRDCLYYDEETDEYYCEDCYNELLAEREKDNDDGDESVIIELEAV